MHHCRFFVCEIDLKYTWIRCRSTAVNQIYETTFYCHLHQSFFQTSSADGTRHYLGFWSFNATLQPIFGQNSKLINLLNLRLISIIFPAKNESLNLRPTLGSSCSRRAAAADLLLVEGLRGHTVHLPTLFESLKAELKHLLKARSACHSEMFYCNQSSTSRHWSLMFIKY